MFTQCPHCLTLFRINGEQLKVAAGRVRCCQCHQAFNALDSLQENPVAKPAHEQPQQTSDSELEDWTPLAEPDALSRDTLNLDWDQLYDAANLKEDLVDSDLSPFMEQDNGLETEPDYFASGGESQMSSLLDSDSSPVISLVEAPTEDDEAEPATSQPNVNPDAAQMPPSPTPRASKGVFERDEFPWSQVHPADRQPQTLSSFTTKLKDEASTAAQNEPAVAYTIDQMFENDPFSYTSFFWNLGSLLLVCTLILQLAWHYRDQVIHKEIGQQLLTQMCNILDCTVPLRRDTSKILVEYRDLRAHPDEPNALQLQLHMVNRASFDQPYPKLHLSLFNDEEKLIAERTFVPQEYLPNGQPGDALMRRSQSLQINLELLDPGKDMTGFKFEFL
jgi:predicted Zn finger-like uncharacterized protein